MVGSISSYPQDTTASYSNIRNFGESTQAAPGRESSPAECETCSSRKYQDESNEMVSFKSPGHISPEASRGKVMAHEMEHVGNAYEKAAKGDAKVVSASVTLQNSVCAECGRTYVAGGETTTQIKYFNEENPYQQDKKAQDAINYSGSNINLAV